MMSNPLHHEIGAFLRRYYLRAALWGLTLFGVAQLLLVPGLLTFEYFFRMGKVFRATLFYGWLILSLLSLAYWVILPMLRAFGLIKRMTHQQAARLIGEAMPNIGDKLLNTLQLLSGSAQQNTALLAASLQQRIGFLTTFKFFRAVDFRPILRRSRVIFIPLLLAILGFIFVPYLFTESAHRIINYNQDFIAQAPFEFDVKTNPLQAFADEDFNFSFRLKGNLLPEKALLIEGSNIATLYPDANGTYNYTFHNLERNLELFIEAAGFRSQTYKVQLLHKPALNSLKAKLTFPGYLGKKPEIVNNAGNITVPEGTNINWELSVSHADSVFFSFADQNRILAKNIHDNIFEVTKTVRNSSVYSFLIANKVASLPKPVVYSIEVTPDLYPTIEFVQQTDSLLFEYIALAGKIEDDYGITSLKLNYRIAGQQKPTQFTTAHIYYNPSVKAQNFVYEWNIEQLKLKLGEYIEYYISVTDNDGVNGNKTTKTPTQTFRLPDLKSVEEATEALSAQAEQDMQSGAKHSEQMKKQIEELSHRMKAKKSLDWEDKKKIEELLDSYKKIEDKVENLNEKLDQKQNLENKLDQQDLELKEKMDKLKELTENVLDPKTKELLDQLKKLMEQNARPEQINDALEKLDRKQTDIMNELERAIEMLKQIEMEQKLEKTIDKAEKLAEEQLKLADGKPLDEEFKKQVEKSDSATNKSDNEKKDPNNDQNKNDDQNKNNNNPDNQKQPNGDNKNQNQQDKAKQDQQTVNKAFEELKDDIKKMNEMNKDLENKRNLDDLTPEMELGDQLQEEIEQEMNENDSKGTQNKQKQSGQNMKSMAMKMKQAQQEQEMQERGENIQTIRRLLKNLIVMSKTQEELLIGFKNVNSRMPQFVTLSRKQLNLKQDGQVVEDSLLALAKRVFEVQSFITREVGDMNYRLANAAKKINERQPQQASAEQQFAMTAMNNLANMLTNSLEQMQEQQKMNMPGKGNSKSNKKKDKGSQPSLGDMQKQLNQKMQDLMKSGKTGRELSQELAKLAAEQESLRKRMGEIQKNLERMGDPDAKKQAGELGNMANEMEKTEEELVNKRLTQQLINRQKQILTRLLESEKAMREREFDEQRKATTATDKKRKLPPSFEKYLNEQQKQTEMLKSVKPEYTPFYKEQATQYFRKLQKQ